MTGSRQYQLRKKQQRKLEQQTRVLTIQPGCLFWDITVKPIGCMAVRAGDKGFRLTNIEKLPADWHGCNRIGYHGLRKIAFHTDYTREHYHDK